MLELQNLCYLSNIIWVTKSRRMKWTGLVARMADRRGAYRVWCGNVRERALGRPRHRWYVNSEMDLEK